MSWRNQRRTKANNSGCEYVDKTGQELQRHLKGPIYVFSADLSRASQTTEVLTITTLCKTSQ